MNNRIYLALVLMLATLVLCQSCGHGGGLGHNGNQLIAADSLLHLNNPDSAMQVLSSIDGAVLRSAGDRAYYALLLTQAQYRCYAEITSDSTINVALDYYKRHDGEQEKLARSYIYKGAVTEVLGNPESAMTYDKQACSTAAPDDHFNLGYAKMRIGCLYRDYLVMDSADILNLKQALQHFEQVPDSVYILNCLSTIGGSYINVNDDSALVYLERADSLAKALGNNYVEVTNSRYIADLKMFSHDLSVVEQAKNIALASLADDVCPLDEKDHLHLIAAFTLAKLNKADSANLYINRVDKEKLSEGLLVLYNRCLAELARCKGDIQQFLYYYDWANGFSDSLLSNNLQRQLRFVEAKFDNEVLRNKSLTYRNHWIISLLAALLFAVVLLAAVMAMRHKLAQHRRLVEESEMTIEQLRSDAQVLASQLNKHQAMSEELKQAIQDQIELFTQLVEQHVTKFAKSPSGFSKAFAQAYSNKRPDKGFWKALRAYVNARYNNIIDESIAAYPALNETDVNYLALYCCELPTSIIMACMGYKEAHSAYNKKRRVADTLGTPANLDAYIKLYK